jgi:hypothetical protein
VNQSPPLPIDHVRSLVGRRLYTLDRGEWFDIEKFYPSGLRIRLHTGLAQFVYLTALERAWRLVQTDRDPELTALNTCNKGLGSGNTAGGPYIAAVLASLPNVQYHLAPIRLYRQDGRCPLCGAAMGVPVGDVIPCSRSPLCTGTRRCAGRQT